MCTALDNGDIIIFNDDDDVADGNRDVSYSESSVVILETEDVPRKDCALSPSKLDEDVVVTFTRPAELLPHARHDCPIHPFTATDNCITPVSGNQHRCEQCFCYICDKLASTCDQWHVSQVCHCNSHKKSNFWNTLRNCFLLGQLEAFKLILSEMDHKHRHAEMLLQIFKIQLKDNFTLFLQGKSVGDSLVYDYTPMYECVSSFLNKADKEDDRAAAIMRLAAAEAFIQHVQAERISASKSPFANVTNAKVVLMQRVVGSVQKQMVMADFPPCFRQKLQDFYSKLYFSPELKNMRLSLSVRPWDDVLLVSVLKGQNVLGVRTNKGKKDSLLEDMAVILLRVELLLEQERFRELSRYVRAVHTDQPKCFLLLKELIPFFMCLDGDFTALQSTSFLIENGLASRLTPQIFQLYLRMLSTAMAPKWTISQTCELSPFKDKWAPIEGAEPLTCLELVRFALKVHRCCLAVRMNSECWTYLLQIVQGAVASLPEPSLVFLQEAVHTVQNILQNKSSSNIQILPHFVSQFQDQAMLLLVTGALSQIILHPDLSPVIPILCTFQKNQWALRWFWNNLPSSDHRVDIVKKIYQELKNHAEAAKMCFPTNKALFPAAKDWDHRLQLNDLLPLLLSLEGNFPAALNSLFLPGNGPVSHLTPHAFQFYLQMFNTATAARLTCCYMGELCSVLSKWQPINGAVPLTSLELVRFALMVHRCCPAVHLDSESWIHLLKIVSTTRKKGTHLSEPNGVFLQAVSCLHCEFHPVERVQLQHSNPTLLCVVSRSGHVAAGHRGLESDHPPS
ncbi:uncharacterized protein zgc:112980 isoform X2 [Dunckerocampus dactyliophorus]|uniref:uncharacterized protein zgc:112980 isoform X2 n=1 Tax=Dunckerocampus dactyliophorus TaxID=161453 RepID=UPI002405C6A8|nr:uncharacterized protein zgc:112980 isoform X2 [Dunckerocampus dactyliophorus]